ncbi:hypothetical protein SDRG_00957 [Saprolegnia diclina VS20]|uniref:SH3 domain-containing protein n=1 Tax=Saprolegnia diclina (strain VS20) TaxID=1156394 RepID=T0SGQ3_SAPDV|nr:hypothetical protein SDRG_00957 [Saprolegnia diclina VS20]EQC42117.1 hypothetical protein SDRG_00957 [Saprolegnia diclina VS20]|eukprot:XP_008604686.1 hypothetical protein SDRG_00957 [Saprolegnia diclina VS20]
MQQFPALEALRTSVHALLRQVDAHESDNNNCSSHAPDACAGDVCAAIEACLHHGLKRVSATETVSLWGLVQWTNVAQQKRHRAWLAAHAKLPTVVADDDWYNDMFKDELQGITSLADDNQRLEPSVSESPMTPGLNASIRTANSLLHVTTPIGRVRAWIRQCCNTHILSACLAGLMHPLNQATLQTYFEPSALCLNEDAREIFVGLTSTLDRLTFGFALDNGPTEETKVLPPSVPSVAAPTNHNVLQVLDTKAQRLHELLRHTLPSILSPRALDEVGPANETPKLFGVPLASLLLDARTCAIAPVDPLLGVPNLFEGCCRLIDAATAVGTPGLFAAKINASRFAQLTQQVQAVGCLSIWSSVHHGIILLIKFLRDLPDPIIPASLYGRFRRIHDLKGRHVQVLALTQLVGELHWSVKPLLYRLCATISRVLKLSNDTSVDRLADVFVRVLFPRSAPAADEASLTQLVALLFLNADAILAEIRGALSDRCHYVMAKLERVAAIPRERRLEVPTTSLAWTQFREAYGLACESDDTLRASLRGGGRLVLQCMLHFLAEHQEIAQQIIAQRASCDVDAKHYPVRSASVYLVRMLVELLGFDRTPSATDVVDLDTRAWLARCDGVCDEPLMPLPTHAGVALVTRGLWPLFDDAKAFERLFGMSLLLFDRNWTRSGATCMDFSTILTETQCQMQSLLRDEPETISDLWQRWSDRISQQYLQPATQAPRALAHMRSYVVVWEGGLTVRAAPTTKCEALGTRRKGDRIETVLKAGDWLKIRDAPGVQDAGWVRRRTATATLLELVA